MSCTCGAGGPGPGPAVCCCHGIEVLTPESVANPPGRRALRYRAGTHRTFLSTMLARLSSVDLPGLWKLTTRERDDPSIALLDCWATAADVLTFYQERIANEGYLRTATEQRSVIELARLVGYVPRPGVAAGTYLAFTLEQGHVETIPVGTRAQSVPGPGELPQSYETSDPLPASDNFNELKIRLSRPQLITKDDAKKLPELWLAGTATKLRPNDALLIRSDNADITPALRFVESTEEDVDADRTRVVLQGAAAPPRESRVWESLKNLVEFVAQGKHVLPKRLPRLPIGEAQTDTALRLAQLQHPELAGILYPAWANATVTQPDTARVYALRVKTALFGANAPKRPNFDGGHLTGWSEWGLDEQDNVLDLDNAYPEIKDGTLVAVVDATKARRGTSRRDVTILGARANSPTRVEQVSRSDYGIAAKVTRIALSGLDKWSWQEGNVDVLRPFTVYAQSEELPLAEAPITDDVCAATLELADLYEGLEPGRLLVVSGERADVPGVTDVPSAELVSIAEVRQSAAGADGVHRPGEKNHTYLELSGHGLSNCYERKTLKIYANVVHATHGESKAEVLGSGEATKSRQQFTLRSKPLTYVSAPTPTGVASSLEIRIDGVRWPERPWLLGLSPTDRGYVTTADEQPATTAIFPNGREGRRLPTGAENVRARYRAGIGRPGNTDAGRITLLATKPLGVRDVSNPLPATGGADPEGRDSAREHAPLPLKSLDRLVSLTDYRDFSRVFAGVGKAAADRLSDGTRQVIVVTVAGDGGALLTHESDVIVNLRRSLRLFGDPSVRILVLPATRLVLTLSAAVRLLPDYEWSDVGPRVRATLLGAFGFDQRDLGEGVPLSQVLAVIQAVPGVYSSVVDPASFTSTPKQTQLPAGTHPAPRVLAHGARRGKYGVLAAQHLYLAPELPELLVLREVTT
jgi:Baseplate J-like protein